MNPSTNSPDTNTPDTATPTRDRYPAGDPRAEFLAAIAVAGSVIAQVTVDDLRKTTPCPDFDVEVLTGHLLVVANRAIAIAEGRPAADVPPDGPLVDQGNWHPAWTGAEKRISEVWADDALLGTEMTLPFGQFPGALALAFYTAEVLVHAWDLATAIDAAVVWDQDLAERALQVVQVGIPAEGRGPEMPFDPVVQTGDDAPAMDRLVAWVGRVPATAR